MTQIIAPKGKRLVWYLAMEEYIAALVNEQAAVLPIAKDEDLLFFWSVSPTVIFGRHQVMENEVNIDFCRANDIQMYRRKSGGGCVYSDEGNLMLSYISPSPHSEQVFGHYLSVVSQALRQLGYPAVSTAHNDILVSDKKVSGNACFALTNSTIVHGTMMWNVNYDMLGHAITPSREKLVKHGVQSVRQRVVNLQSIAQAIPADKPHLTSIEDLQKQLAALLCQQQIALPADAIQKIGEIEQTYLAPEFLYQAHV